MRLNNKQIVDYQVSCFNYKTNQEISFIISCIVKKHDV